MQPNNNLSCIPFYESLEEQDFRKWYAYGEKYPHRVPSDYLIPFYIVIPKEDGVTIDEVEFYNACCDDGDPIRGGSFNISFSDAFQGSNSSLISPMLDNNLKIVERGDFNEIVYYASHNSLINLPKGLCYMVITLSNGKSYYSDVFFVDTRANLGVESIRIEWWNEENVEYEGGLIPYGISEGGALFKSEIYLDSEIGKPTYNFTEEGEERNGYFFPMKQISEKSYNMGFVAPEYLCDVMRLIRMADVVRITDKFGRIYNVEQFEMDVNWMEHGHYAEVSCTFQTDTIVKKVGKAYVNISDR